MVRSFFAVASLAVFLSACSHGGAKGGRHGRLHAAASPLPIPTTTAVQATLRGTSTISGVIAPLQNVALSSQLAEVADAVPVNEGEHVQAGQLLAQLDTADLRAQLAQAQATIAADERTAASADAKVIQAQDTAHLNIGTGNDQVSSARAAVAQAQQTLANDTGNLNRDRTLLANGYIAQQAVDQQQTLVNNDAQSLRTVTANLQTAATQQQVNGTNQSGLQAANVAAVIADARAAHAQIDEARAQAQQYAAQIAKATIVSPVTGVVVNRNLNPGEYPGARTLFTVQELANVYAELNASSSDTFAIPVGASVALNVSGAGAKTYAGRVVAVLGQVQPGSTNFTVKVLLRNADGKLEAGLPVTADIALPAVSGIGIPTTAFLDDTHTTVMAADTEPTGVVAKTIDVHEVSTNGTTSIVTGLKAGTDVVTNGQLGLSNGQSLAQE